LGPESAFLAFDSRAFTGTGDVGAWESSANDIGNSSPRFPVEGSDIVPHWEPRKNAVPLATEEYSSAIRVDLDGANGGMPEKQSAEDSSPDSSKKV
jgi:hypothetical protein